MFHVKHSIIHTEIQKDQLKRVNLLLDQYQDQFEKYSERLIWWNKKINLVSREVSRETVFEHIMHSLLLYDAVKRINPSNILDTGTGGGLPGIPLALCFPEKEFILNDIVGKKIMAVKQMVLKLGLKNIKVDIKPINSVELVERTLVVTKHAFKINELVLHLENKPWDQILFLKGEREAIGELNEIKESLIVNIINLDKVIQSGFYKGKAIVEVSKNNE
ncbi:MAG: hypothetical protein BalsKO_28700 [Balneolaceae bacterium]